jgi:predicted NBD/HSP70 family sugar kinase
MLVNQSTPTSAGTIFHLIKTGAATTRAELARHTGASASTMALRIDELLQAGYIEESGEGASSGGRRPRNLAVRDAPEVVAGIDLGENHAIIVLLNRRGETVAQAVHEVSLRADPDTVLGALIQHVRQLTDATPGRTLAALAISLPGPLDARTGRLLSPTRMPGWSGVDVRERLEALSGIPSRASNDANSMALAEYAVREGSVRDLLFVKAGSGIGTGSIVDGSLYTGFRGVAGDISHTTLTNAPAIPCSCGRVGCLDMVASGSAIVESVRERGGEAASIDDVLGLAKQGHPGASEVLREAGRRIGEVLSTIVNFFNPQVLALGGLLATSDAFTAGVRQAIYTQCLPMTTDLLEISVAQAGRAAGAVGIAWDTLEKSLQPEYVDAVLQLAGA